MAEQKHQLTQKKRNVWGFPIAKNYTNEEWGRLEINGINKKRAIITAKSIESVFADVSEPYLVVEPCYECEKCSHHYTGEKCDRCPPLARLVRP